MLYTIASEIPGRVRLRCGAMLFTENEAHGVELALLETPGISYAEIHPANGSVLLRFAPGSREVALAAVSALDPLALPQAESLPESEADLALAEEDNRFAMELCGLVVHRLLRRFLMPLPLRNAFTLIRAARYALEGLRHLLAGQLTVEVLDATAIAAACVRGFPDLRGRDASPIPDTEPIQTVT